VKQAPAQLTGQNSKEIFTFESQAIVLEIHMMQIFNNKILNFTIRNMVQLGCKSLVIWVAANMHNDAVI
jgi:hypothetical protein